MKNQPIPNKNGKKFLILTLLFGGAFYLIYANSFDIDELKKDIKQQ
ncbi:hypothetical protein ['Camptotheca acuminata' phytoplasma]